MTTIHVTQQDPASTRRTKGRAMSPRWLVPALIALAVPPLLVGAIHVVQLTTGAEITAENARILAMRLPIILHIVGAAVYALFGSLQFATRFRQSHLAWHRRAGRVLLGFGLVVGLTALWMTLFYPAAKDSGPLLFTFRMIFSTGMLVAIVKGFVAIRQGDVPGHRAWMMRAYAIGLGASTQMITLMVGVIAFGPLSVLAHDLLMGAAWLINLVIAEALARKPQRRTSLKTRPTVPAARAS